MMVNRSLMEIDGVQRSWLPYPELKGVEEAGHEDYGLIIIPWEIDYLWANQKECRVTLFWTSTPFCWWETERYLDWAWRIVRQWRPMIKQIGAPLFWKFWEMPIQSHSNVFPVIMRLLSWQLFFFCGFSSIHVLCSRENSIPWRSVEFIRHTAA